MRGLQLLWAATVGWMVDTLLTELFVRGGLALAGITTTELLDFSRPLHILLGLALPILMTAIGGGVAGWIAPEDATPAGALVGGLGLITMLAYGIDPTARHTLAFIIAQCIAVVIAALTANGVAARRRSRI
jgi:hypothetical protein